MLEVSVRQARQTLARLINQTVTEECPIIITVHDKPKAVLLSIEAYERLTHPGGVCAEALEAAQQLRVALASQVNVLPEDWVASARAEREAALLL